MTHSVYSITPCPKPRMTNSDKWKNRPTVMRYWAFKEEVQLIGVELPLQDAHVIFKIPMPESWSIIKKKRMDMAPHRQTPDLDNLLKALCDACYDNDSHISDVRVSKWWDYKGSIEVITNC